MSIEAVRDKFRWNDEAAAALRTTERAVEALVAAPGFRSAACDLDLTLEGKPGADLATAVAQACAALSECSYNGRHPTALAHMVPPPAVASMIGEFLKGAANQCAFTVEQGPLVPAVERVVLDWIASRLGMGSNCGGLITSGGTISNFIATYLALVRARRLFGQDARLALIATDQAHFSVQKAACLVGLDAASVYLAPTQADGRVTADALLTTVHQAVAAGRKPFLFVCTAGTTNAGVVEPAELFAGLAEEHSAWLHLDGAHGAFLALSARDGLGKDDWRRANSVSWDPHKTLFVGYPAGALIVRNAGDLDPLGWRPDYAFHDAAALDPAFRHLEGSRGFDALKIWLTIRHLGADGLAALADHLLDLATHLAERVNADPQFELVTRPDLNIVCFRYVDTRLSPGVLDAINCGVRGALYAEGDTLLSQTRVGGRSVLRAVLLNPFTTTDDLDHAFTAVSQAAIRIASDFKASDAVSLIALEEVP